jgi:outer membrane receptor for ferrienterochelin and colicins
LQDNIPGIVITPNGMGDNMRVKGLNSRYILMLVDGERLVSEGAGGNINLDQIDVGTIRRIEIVDGASSALYGSNAVGAVINVITKEPVHNIEAGAGQSWESHNTSRSRLDVGSASGKFSVRAGGFRNSSDGFGGDGEGPYAARYADHGANVKLGYRPTERSDVNIVGRWFRHETFNPAGTMNVAHPLTGNLTVGANGGWTTPDNRNTLRLSANFDRYSDYDVLERKNDERRRNNTASWFSGRAVNTFAPSPTWEVVGGVEYNREENYAVKTLGTEPTAKSVDDANVFAQAQYKPLPDFDIIGGARYTRNSAFGSAFTPKLSLMYRVAGFRFRGGLGTSFRAPSIKELYYDFDHQGMFWVYGNPDLRPEKGLYASLSAEYTLGGFNASLAGYHNRIDNKITRYDVINAAGGNEKYYKNVSNATLRGFDVNAACTLPREVTLRGSYSFCDAVDSSTGLQLPSNVRHSGTVSATWNGRIRRSPFSLQFAGRMNSPILYQEMVADASGGQDALTTQSKAYSVWKAVLVKPFTVARKHVVEFTFKVDNLFDFRESSFINPGRQYLVGIRYNFKTQLGNN